MPLAIDANNKPIQCLTPLRSHVIMSGPTTIGPFDKDTVAVEISTRADISIAWTYTSDPPFEYPIAMMAGYYYVYATNAFEFLHISYTSPDETTIITEMT